ncbi:MAG TPA: N-acetyltransferase [Candidatus Sulfotelmatobacter sp.]|nr:N-acetyltransferase [Candidatus Sulfotelmatobacter sp.]
MFSIVPERPHDAASIEQLLDLSFGPDRHAKTVYALRRDVDPIAELSFVALDADGTVQASIRYWPILIGERWPAVLLGPVAVNPARRGEGMGKGLIRHTLALAADLGHRICVLVGDKDYYEPFGFSNAPAAGLALPGWAEPARFQVCALVPGALDGVSGMVGRPRTPNRRAVRSHA